jgi:hypothetical protein
MEKRVQTVGLDGQTNEILETKVPPEVKTLLDRHIFRVGNSF